MRFEENSIFHVYNQGINRQPIFFTEANYHFFLRKMRSHLLPYADLLCYCLMPNHFHWLIMPKAEGLQVLDPNKPELSKVQRLCRSIGTLLGSYTQAINRQEERTGSLFRAKTKAKDGWVDAFVTIDGEKSHLFFRPDNDYARQCFEYIHQNPVKAGIVV